jgi:hypothetical protein
VIFQSDHGYNIERHGIHTKGSGDAIFGGVNGPKRPKHVGYLVAHPAAHPTDWARKLRVWLVGFGLESNRDSRR